MAAGGQWTPLADLGEACHLLGTRRALLSQSATSRKMEFQRFGVCQPPSRGSGRAVMPGQTQF